MLGRPSLILPRGLAFPGNFKPGFDSRHPVVQASGVAGPSAMLLSAIPQGAAFVDMLNGVPSTVVAGTPARGMDGNLGPVGVFSGSQTLSLPASITCPPLMTFGAFIRPTTINGNIILITSSTTGGLIFLLNNVTNVLNLQMNGASSAPSTIALVTGVPYFVCASCKLDVTGSYRFSYAAIRLDNGQIFTSQVTSSQGAIGAFTPAQSGTLLIGSANTVGQPFIGNMGPVMMCPGYVQARLLTEWLPDPWSFHYPTTPEIVAFDAEMVKTPSGAGPSGPPAPLSPFGMGI